ncbi:MAG: metallophosphoesterase [Myxococcales bacterium]|nr:metallophosphoesterase [Myxococcales bacterium]
MIRRTQVVFGLMAGLLLGCGPRTSRITPVAVGVQDGAHVMSNVALRIAVVGHAATASDDLFDHLRELDPDLVLLMGDAVRRSHHEEWAQLQHRVRDLAVVPLVGRNERRGDRALRGFSAAWEGLGVAGLDTSDPWLAFELSNGQTLWRLVVLDPDRQSLGSRWMDQLFWVPKVVGGEDYDQLIVAIGEGPGHMDGLSSVSPGAEALLDLVRRHADPSRFSLVLSGGADVPAAVVPGGRWGEAWVSTGRTSAPAAPLHARIGAMELEDELLTALIRSFEARTGSDLDGVRNSGVFPPALAPVLGWWLLEVRADTVSLHLQLDSSGGWDSPYSLRRSRSTGWSGTSTGRTAP